jgi:hypothetical protein
VASLRLAEAQQLSEGLVDDLLRPALVCFAYDMRQEMLRQLVSAIRQSERNTMKEAHLAGKVEVYETLIKDLEYFAAQELERASQ